MEVTDTIAQDVDDAMSKTDARNLDLFYDPEADNEDSAWLAARHQERHGVARPRTSAQGDNEGVATATGNSSNAPDSTPRRDQTSEPAPVPASRAEDSVPDQPAPPTVTEDKKRKSAVLSCPACFSVVSTDCQVHAHYQDQYRAMFVQGVHVNTAEVVSFEADPSQPTRVRVPPGAVVTLTPDIYYPVQCEYCSTELGVLDEDGIYHFHNVFAGF